jgi:hypothetical protein
MEINSQVEDYLLHNEITATTTINEIWRIPTHTKQILCVGIVLHVQQVQRVLDVGFHVGHAHRREFGARAVGREEQQDLAERPQRIVAHH